MKRFFATLALAVVSTFLAACTQNAAPVTEPSPVVTASPTADDSAATEEDIIKFERDWVAAIVNKDVAALERILAEDFVGTSVRGETFRKAQAIEDIKKGAYVVQSMNMDEVSANVYGDAAVAFTSQEEKSAYDGVNSSGHFHFTNTWIKRNGSWQVVASHGSPYAK